MKQVRPFLSSLVVIALLALMTGCGDQRTDAERLQSAFGSFQEGKYRAAFIELKNLLQANPRNKDARLLLGSTTLKMGDIEAAEKEFSRAQDLGASADEYYVLKMQAQLLLGKYQEILDSFDTSDLKVADNRQVAQVFQAKALFGSGEIEEAELKYEQIIASADSTEALRRAYLGLADLQRAKGNMPGAIESTKKALAYDPGSPESLVAAGQLALANRDFKQAKEYFEKGNLDSKASSNEKFFLSAGEVEAALGLNDIEEAKRASNRLFAVAPQHPLTGYLLGRVAYLDGDKVAAYDHIQSVLSKAPRFRPAQLLQGALSLERKEYQQAEMFLSSVLVEQPGNVEARKLLAETHLQMNQPEQAASLLRDAVASGQADQHMVGMLGRATMSMGDGDSSIEALKLSIKQNPKNTETKLALAAAYIAAGEATQALALFEDDQGGLDERRRELLVLLAAVQKKDMDKATSQAEKITSIWSNDEQAMNLVGGFYFSQGEYDKARSVFNLIYKKTPNDINALTNLSRIDMLQKNFTQAESRYEEFLERNPDHEGALLSLAYINQSEGNNKVAIEYVEKAHEAHPDSEAPASILARVYMFNKDYEKASRYAAKAIESNPKSASAHVTHGLVDTQRGRHENALNSYITASKLRPKSKDILRNKGKAELALSLYAQARATFEAIWQLDPGDLDAARTVMMLEVKADRPEKADDILQKLKADFPDNAKVMEIEGDLRHELKDTAAAVIAYQRAYKAEPSRSLVLKQYRIAQESGANATSYLRDWLKVTPKDDGVRMLLAQQMQRNDQSSEAIQEYEKLVISQPNSALALNNLAWLYFQQNDSDVKVKAIEMAQQAYNLAKQNPQIADTYGWLLFRSGQIDKGRAILAEAEKLAQQQASPSLSDIVYHHAAAMNEAGDRENARVKLQKILLNDAKFSSRPDAQLLFDTL